MRRIAVVLIGIALACDGPTASDPNAVRPVQVGEVVQGTMPQAYSLRRFAFTAVAGDEYAVFFQALQGVITLAVVDATGHLVGTVTASPATGNLFDTATPTFAVAASGSYRVHVEVLPPGSGGDFRFVVHRINTRPELAPVRFSLGDSVSGETLDPFVDVDVFETRLLAGQELFGGVRAFGPTDVGSVSLTVIDPGSGVVIAGALSIPGATDALTRLSWTGWFVASAERDYRFEVRSGVGAVPPFRGPYSFSFYSVDRRPEHVPANVSPGAVVVGERLERIGDIDQFQFMGTAGDELDAYMQSTSAYNVRLDVLNAAGSRVNGLIARPSDTLLEARSGLFTLPQTGLYTVRIRAPDFNPGDTGSYRFLLYPLHRPPELSPAVIGLGDTISGETIETPSDIDEFRFSAAGPSSVNVFLQITSGPPDARMNMAVYDSAGEFKGSNVALLDTSLTAWATGPIPLFSSAPHLLRVTSLLDYHGVAYRVYVYPINEAPEIALPSLSVGDSVVNETIELPGDVDTFTLAIIDTAMILLRLSRPTAVPGTCLVADVTAPNLQSVAVLQVPALCIDGPQTTGGYGPFQVVPGTYRITLRGSQFSGAPYRGLYGLQVLPAP